MSLGIRIDDARRLEVIGISVAEDSNTLQNEIDRVWQRANFNMIDSEKDMDYLEKGDSKWQSERVLIPDDVWNRLKPALQLATLALRRSKPFFMQLLCCRIEADPFIPDARMYSAEYAYRSELENAKGDKLYAARMRHLSQHHRIYFADTLEYGSWASTTMTVMHGECHAFTVLCHQYLQRFKDPSFDEKALDIKQRIWWSLAMHLVHEMAHTIYSLRRGFAGEITPNATKRDEPYMNESDEFAELGHAWEDWFFGGDISFVDQHHVTHGVHGHAWMTRTQKTEFALGAAPMCLKARSVSKFFNPSSWDSADCAFDFELTPARSHLPMLITDHPPCDCYSRYFNFFLSGGESDGKGWDTEYSKIATFPCY